MPVEHLIIYNIEGLDAAGVAAMTEEGTRMLSKIPGVRAVFTGTAFQPEAAYHYTWIVRFCHTDVIESYKHHPDHTTFADTHFRPVAKDRISIDYV